MSDSNPVAEQPASPVVRKRRRWLMWCLTPFIIALVLAALAPMIVSVPAVRDTLLAKFLPADAGQIEMKQLSLGWLSAAEIRGLRYQRGPILVEAELVKCDRTLLDLARNWSNVGKVEIVAPNIVVDQSQQADSPDESQNKSPGAKPKTDERGGPADKSSPRPINAEISVTNGKITVLGKMGEPKWIAQNVECKVNAPAGCTEATLEARAVAGDGRGTVPITASGKLKWPVRSLPQDLVEAQLDCDGIDLAMINDVLAPRSRDADMKTRPAANADARAEFAGIASAHVRVQSADNGAITLQARANVKDFAFVDPKDEFELREPSVELTASGTWTRDTLSVESVKLEAAGMALDASVATRWPVRSIAGDLVEGHASFSGIPLKLANPFLDRDDGDNAIAVSAAPALELRGVASGVAEVRPGAGGVISAGAKIDIVNFAFVDRANKVEVREPKLMIRAAGGLANGTATIETFRVTAGRTILDASGSARWPVQSIATDLVEGHLKFSGVDLALANAYLNAADATRGSAKRLELAGVADGTADAQPADGGAIVGQASVAVNGFSFVDEARNFTYREPKVVISATARVRDDVVQLESSRIQAGATIVNASGAVHLPMQSLATDLRELAATFSGVDLRLVNPLLSTAVSTSVAPQQAGKAPARSQGLRLAGLASGSVSLRPQAGGLLIAETRLSAKDFAFLMPSNEFEFRDPQISLSASAGVKGETIEVKTLRVQSASVMLDGAGRVSEISTEALSDLAGTIQCDWQSLESHMSPVLPKGMSLAGKERRQWSLRGPLKGRTGEQIAQLIQADLGTRFEFPEFFGLDLAPVEFAAKLNSGTLRVEPINTTLQRGTVSLQPTVTFGKDGPVAVVAAGRLLDRVVIDKPLCDRVLRFVNPLIAGRGDLSGELSLDVDRFELPLGSDGLERGYIVGKLALDNAEFRPDDSLAQILSVAGIRVPPVVKTSQSIDVRMEDGRIYHSGVKLPVGDDYVLIDGSVGLDHTLSMRVDVPLGTKLAGGNERLGRLLRGQRLQVPVSGTLERIRFDQNAIAANIQKMIQTGLRDSLSGEDLINGLLKKTQKK